MTTHRNEPEPSRLPRRLLKDGWWLVPSPAPLPERPSAVILRFPSRARPRLATVAGRPLASGKEAS